jgi:hypothetical protein
MARKTGSCSAGEEDCALDGALHERRINKAEAIIRAENLDMLMVEPRSSSLRRP